MYMYSLKINFNLIGEGHSSHTPKSEREQLISPNIS